MCENKELAYTQYMAWIEELKAKNYISEDEYNTVKKRLEEKFEKILPKALQFMMKSV